MKKIISLLFALLMILSVAFVGDLVSSKNPFAAEAQTVSSKRRGGGVIRRGYRGGRWVTRKVWRGGKWVTIKTWQGAKWTGRKSWRTGRKVVSRSKKVVY